MKRLKQRAEICVQARTVDFRVELEARILQCYLKNLFKDEGRGSATLSSTHVLRSTFIINSVKRLLLCFASSVFSMMDIELHDGQSKDIFQKITRETVLEANCESCTERNLHHSVFVTVLQVEEALWETT